MEYNPKNSFLSCPTILNWLFIAPFILRVAVMCRLAALADLSRALAKSSSALAARAALCRASSRAAVAEASALVWMAAALAARKSLAVKFVFKPAACKAARTACVVLALSTTTLILNFSL